MISIFHIYLVKVKSTIIYDGVSYLLIKYIKDLRTKQNYYRDLAQVGKYILKLTLLALEPLRYRIVTHSLSDNFIKSHMTKQHNRETQQE